MPKAGRQSRAISGPLSDRIREPLNTMKAEGVGPRHTSNAGLQRSWQPTSPGTFGDGGRRLGTLARLIQLRADVIEPKIAQFHGRIVGAAGDSLLVESSSAIRAVQCTIEVQEGLPTGMPTSRCRTLSNHLTAPATMTRRPMYARSATVRRRDGTASRSLIDASSGLNFTSRII